MAILTRKNPPATYRMETVTQVINRFVEELEPFGVRYNLRGTHFGARELILSFNESGETIQTKEETITMQKTLYPNELLEMLKYLKPRVNLEAFYSLNGYVYAHLGHPIRVNILDDPLVTFTSVDHILDGPFAFNTDDLYRAMSAYLSNGRFHA